MVTSVIALSTAPVALAVYIGVVVGRVGSAYDAGLWSAAGRSLQHSLTIVVLIILVESEGVPTRLSQGIRLEKVSFAYPGSPAVIEDLDLVLPAGVTVALVGENGAGKPTLIKLLTRMSRPPAPSEWTASISSQSKPSRGGDG